MPAVLILIAVEAALCAVVYLAVGRDRRRFALALLMVTAPLEVYRTPLLGVNLSLFRISLVIGVSVVMVLPDGRRRLRGLASHRLALVYGGIAALMLLSLATMSDNVSLAARLAAQVLVGLVAFATVYVLAARQSAAKLAGYVVAGAALPVLAAAWQRIGPELGGDGLLPLLSLLPVAEGLEVTRGGLPIFESTPRARATFGDPTHFGVYLVLVASLALAGASRLVKGWRSPAAWAHAVLLALILVTIMATYSRSAWLGLLAAMAALGIGAWNRMVLTRPTLLRPAALPILLALAFVVVSAPFSSAIERRLDPSAQGNVVSNTTHERTVTVAIDDLIANPLTGIGLADLGPQLDQDVRSSGAHSSYLTVAAELGAPGLVLLVLALVITLQLLRRRADMSAGNDRLLLRSLAAGYLGFAVAALTYDIWWDDFHFVFLGLIAALCLRPEPAPRPAG